MEKTPTARETVMLINVLEGQETRIALMENGRLEEFHIERASKETLVGNVYKGCVENVHASLQAAFVSIGLEKNAFLHASEVIMDDRSRRRFRGKRPLIQELVREGQELMVQVIRDEFGEKGPSVTTDISLPGRFLVLTPKSSIVGVSKKITHPAQRSRLRHLLKELEPPRNLGFIIRTTGAETTARDLKADLDHLVRSWTTSMSRYNESSAPALIYQESDLVIRTIRDLFNSSVEKVIVDQPAVYSRLLSFYQSIMPKFLDRVAYYSGATPLFHRYRLNEQIEQLNQKVVNLPSGGTIVVEQTEAMYAIDVNSGRYVREGSPEMLAFKTNMEAAREVMRQLRLRDMGGIILIDFIDMKMDRHRQAVEQVLMSESGKDRSQMVILPMSQFCLTQIARQKIRPSLQLMAYEPCPHCSGRGLIKTVESIGVEVIRMLRSVLQREGIAVVEVGLHPDVAAYVREKMGSVEDLERQYSRIIHLNTTKEFAHDHVEVTAFDPQGEKVPDFST